MLKRHTFSMSLALAALLAFAGPAFADEVIDGSTGPGSVYRLIRPTNWNGILLLYAHGFVSKDQPVGIPDDAQLVASLSAARGFAVAVSSFSENGWVVKDGTQRTHQLLGLFTSKFGNPARVYAAGGSMGGLIAIQMIEKYPRPFSGVLPACAVASGSARNYDYYLNVRVLFDLFYPGVLPGTAVDVPDGIDVIQDILNPALFAMISQSSPRRSRSPAWRRHPSRGRPQFHGALRVDRDRARCSRGLSGNHRAHAGSVVFRQHGDAVHGSPLPATLAYINANVQRFSGTPAAQNTMDHNYTPTGDLRIPALTLSTYRDPVAPGFHRAIYGQTVAAMGNSDRLVQREVLGTGGGYGHCTFTPDELLQAFLDLVLWGEFGVKPTP